MDGYGRFNENVSLDNCGMQQKFRFPSDMHDNGPILQLKRLSSFLIITGGLLDKQNIAVITVLYCTLAMDGHVVFLHLSPLEQVFLLSLFFFSFSHIPQHGLP
jgi:hypothetical protein